MHSSVFYYFTSVDIDCARALRALLTERGKQLLEYEGIIVAKLQNLNAYTKFTVRLKSTSNLL